MYSQQAATILCKYQDEMRGGGNIENDPCLKVRSLDTKECITYRAVAKMLHLCLPRLPRDAIAVTLSDWPVA
jgi:hypothetical protein